MRVEWVLYFRSGYVPVSRASDRCSRGRCEPEAAELVPYFGEALMTNSRPVRRRRIAIGHLPGEIECGLLGVCSGAAGIFLLVACPGKFPDTVLNFASIVPFPGGAKELAI